MPRTAFPLTPPIHRAIVEAVEKGAFPHAAAAASGITAKAFDRWMDMADSPGKTGNYKKLRQDVLAAQARARVSAEQRVFEEEPLKWLQSAARGWGAPATDKHVPAFDLLLHPGFVVIMSTIRKQLADQPAALQALASAIQEVTGTAPKKARAVPNSPSTEADGRIVETPATRL